MKGKHTDKITGIVFISGIVVLAITGAWWPGIIIALAVTGLVDNLQKGKTREAILNLIGAAAIYAIIIFELPWLLALVVIVLGIYLSIHFRTRATGSADGADSMVSDAPEWAQKLQAWGQKMQETHGAGQKARPQNDED